MRWATRKAAVWYGAILCVCILLAGCGGGSKRTTRHASPPTAGTLPFRFFSSNSFWNQPIQATTPVDPRSAQLTSALALVVRQEERARVGPWINVDHDSVSIISVPADQPTVAVRLKRSSSGVDAAMVNAWRAVPLPADARPSAGDDDLAIWQPSTDRMWEFFGLGRVNGHWEARWGGAMQHVSRNPGVYGSTAWPGAKPYWGVTATSLPVVGGAMTINQLAHRQIDHALALAVPNTRAGTYASPANRTDGVSAAAGAIPEGARLRLDPNLNIAALKLPPLTRMIAIAAQRYGIVIRDTSGTVAFIGQMPTNAQESAVYRQLFGGRYPTDLLRSFPWDRLQVLKMNLHSVG